MWHSIARYDEVRPNRLHWLLRWQKLWPFKRGQRVHTPECIQTDVWDWIGYQFSMVFVETIRYVSDKHSNSQMSGKVCFVENKCAVLIWFHWSKSPGEMLENSFKILHERSSKPDDKSLQLVSKAQENAQDQIKWSEMGTSFARNKQEPICRTMSEVFETFDVRPGG